MPTHYGSDALEDAVAPSFVRTVFTIDADSRIEFGLDTLAISRRSTASAVGAWFRL